VRKPSAGPLAEENGKQALQPSRRARAASPQAPAGGDNDLDEREDFEGLVATARASKMASSTTAPEGIARTLPQLSRELGVASRTLRNWIGEGMPVRDDRTYDIEAIRAWRAGRDSRRKSTEAEELDNEIRRARLRNLDLEYKARVGQLVPKEDIDRRDVARVIAVKRELLAIPRALAKPLEHLEARKIEAILKDKIHQVIRKFSGQ
jgi:ribosomal protein L29